MVMKKQLLSLCLLYGFLFCACNTSSSPEIEIRQTDDGYKLYVQGRETYIKGVGGTYRLDVAAGNGANAFRTWGGDVDEVRNTLALAAEHGMYVMQGIDMSKELACYFDEEYKDRKRAEVRALAQTFKDDTCLLAWGIGNEIELGNKANTAAAWCFVEELAQIIKSVDKRHLVSTVISYNPSALDSIARYAPSLDYIGMNVYGPMGDVKNVFEKSDYNGPFIITEWGPTGWWETTLTSWKAPIEQTSEEKRAIYEERYTRYILDNPRSLGSFVFLWGQKEERTPTWFSMFVEDGVEGLPLHGEKTPMVEAMQRVWTGREPEQTAPIIQKIVLNGKQPVESVEVKAGTIFNACVDVIDREKNELTYVWEILHEATVLGSGGSYEPRPEREGEVVTSSENIYQGRVNMVGNYRLYVYVLDNTGFVSTVNIPFRVVE